MLQLKLAKPKLGSDISSTAVWDFSARTLHCKNLIYRKILYHGKAKRVMMCLCVCVCVYIYIYIYVFVSLWYKCTHAYFTSRKVCVYVLYVFCLVCFKASLYVL